MAVRWMQEHVLRNIMGNKQSSNWSHTGDRLRFIICPQSACADTNCISSGDGDPSMTSSNNECTPLCCSAQWRITVFFIHSFAAVSRQWAGMSRSGCVSTAKSAGRIADKSCTGCIVEKSANSKNFNAQIHLSYTTLSQVDSIPEVITPGRHP